MSCALAAELLLTFIPGVSSIAGAVITFARVYLAGLMFMQMLLTMAKNGKSGDTLMEVSEKDFKQAMKTPTKEEAKSIISLGKKNLKGKGLG